MRPAITRRATLLSALLSVLAATSALAACGGSDSTSDKYGLIEAGTLLSATSGDQPPFSVMSGGKPSGFTIDLHDEVARRLGLKVTYKQTSTDSGIQGLTAGRYDVVANGLGVTDERKKSVDFAKGEYWSTTAALTTGKSAISSIDGLAGRRVAVITGSVQVAYLKKISGAKAVEFPTQNAAVSALNSGSVDAFLVGGPDAQEYLKQFPQLKVSAEQPVDHPSTVAFPKDHAALRNAYDAQLAAMVQDGTYRKIYDRYFEEPPNAKLLTIWPGLGS